MRHPATLITMPIPANYYDEISKVIPIYKAKSKETLNNYRPISLVSNMSKTLEKVMHKRLCSFMNKHHLLCESQYGFISNHSTVDAIAEFVTKILPSRDKREICLSAYLDLSKAFDTINHDAMWKSSIIMEYVKIPWRGSIVIYHIEGNMYVTREYLQKCKKLTAELHRALYLVLSSLLYM